MCRSTTETWTRVSSSSDQPSLLSMTLYIPLSSSLFTPSLSVSSTAAYSKASMGVWSYGMARELLKANMMSVLSRISDLAVLIGNNFFEAYAGESKDGSPVAVISTGNIVSLNGAVPYEKGIENLSYAFLALFRSCFSHIQGISAGVCLKSSTPSKPRVACLNIWDSLHACYSWILNSDSRSKLQPFVDHLSIDIKYDIFKVVSVSCEAGLSYQFLPQKMLNNKAEESDEAENKEKDICETPFGKWFCFFVFERVP